jgi:hypothetical protein
LRDVANTWTGTTWFIEGDVSDCFGSLDHQVMLSTLAERILDNRFLRLMRNMLQAGYLEDWVWNATLSGVPQGSLCAAAHNPPWGVPSSVGVNHPFSITPAVNHAATRSRAGNVPSWSSRWVVDPV